MIKSLGTVLIIGGTGSGKTTLLKNYIDEVILDKASIFLLDPKMVELFEYKNRDNIVYINKKEDIENDLFQSLNNAKEKKYVFVDEYSEIKLDENLHKKFKYLIKNRRSLNLEIIMTSQNRDSFCNGMRKNSDAVIILNNNFY